MSSYPSSTFAKLIGEKTYFILVASVWKPVKSALLIFEEFGNPNYQQGAYKIFYE